LKPFLCLVKKHIHLRQEVSLESMDVPLVQALKTAVAEENLDTLRHLCLYTTVDVAAEDNYAVRMAAMMGNLPMVQFLCELPPERGVRPRIWWAASEGHLHVVRYLCELPRSVTCDPTRWTIWLLGLPLKEGT
jgi:hypothetical protein